MKLGRLEIDLTELKEFVVSAKKNGYASKKEAKREHDGSKTFVFEGGNFHYTDNYAGSYHAPGSEIVRWQRKEGQRIWQMAYSGGMLQSLWGNEELRNQTFNFLKEALSHVSSKHPFRGPPAYQNDKDFLYLMNVRGDIKRFSGTELIKNKETEKLLFSQDFIGGLVIPK